MQECPDIAYVAALIGDPARANMLTALMSGKALTASELAGEAGVTPQTASAHLSKLNESGMLRVRKQGRHKYFSLANDDVAHVLEGLMGLAVGSGHLRKRPDPKDTKLRKARACYSHLAGDLGTRMFDSLRARGFLTLQGDALTLAPSGETFAISFGIDIASLRSKKPLLCRECLDWSERRSHLAGSLGRGFLSQFENLSWAKRDRKTRIVTFSQYGEQHFAELFPA